LEEKRKEFPRFYFLSNDELLQILSFGSDVKKVEKQINKCFDNLAGLSLVDSGGGAFDIAGMISGEKEVVDFGKSIKIRSLGVEQWLKNVEDSMRGTLQKKIKDAAVNYLNVDRKDWVLGHCG
jgi:dynein heavy chain